jgi:hypothetical protein
VLHSTAGGCRTAFCRSRPSLLLGRGRGSTHMGFPMWAQGGHGGTGPVTDAGVGANRQDVERRAWGLCPDLASRPDVRAIGLSLVDLF